MDSRCPLAPQLPSPAGTPRLRLPYPTSPPAPRRRLFPAHRGLAETLRAPVEQMDLIRGVWLQLLLLLACCPGAVWVWKLRNSGKALGGARGCHSWSFRVRVTCDAAIGHLLAFLSLSPSFLACRGLNWISEQRKDQRSCQLLAFCSPKDPGEGVMTSGAGEMVQRVGRLPRWVANLGVSSE